MNKKEALEILGIDSEVNFNTIKEKYFALQLDLQSRIEGTYNERLKETFQANLQRINEAYIILSNEFPQQILEHDDDEISEYVGSSKPQNIEESLDYLNLNSTDNIEKAEKQFLKLKSTLQEELINNSDNELLSKQIKEEIANCNTAWEILKPFFSNLNSFSNSEISSEENSTIPFYKKTVFRWSFISFVLLGFILFAILNTQNNSENSTINCIYDTLNIKDIEKKAEASLSQGDTVCACEGFIKILELEPQHPKFLEQAKECKCKGIEKIIEKIKSNNQEINQSEDIKPNRSLDTNNPTQKDTSAIDKNKVQNANEPDDKTNTKEKQIDTLLKNANDKFIAKKYDEAITGYKKILVLNPNHKEAETKIKIAEAKIKEAEANEKTKSENEVLNNNPISKPTDIKILSSEVDTIPNTKEDPKEEVSSKRKRRK